MLTLPFLTKKCYKIPKYKYHIFFVLSYHEFYAMLHFIPLGQTNKIFNSWQMLIVAP